MSYSKEIHTKLLSNLAWVLIASLALASLRRTTTIAPTSSSLFCHAFGFVTRIVTKNNNNNNYHCKSNTFFSSSHKPGARTLIKPNVVYNNDGSTRIVHTHNMASSSNNEEEEGGGGGGGEEEATPKKKRKTKATKNAKAPAKKKTKTTKKKTTAQTVTAETTTTTTTGAFQPSRIVDDDEPTPDDIDIEPESITEEELPELKFDQNAIPIPHQPWRRGDTDGCEDPIHSPWRIEAEEIIKSAALSVGGVVTDVTWYMAAVVITIDDDSLLDVNGESGPEIRVYDDNEPMWFDPDDPEPEDDYGIYEGEEDGRMEMENEDGTITSGIPNDPYLEREFDEATGTYMPPPKRPTREEAVRNMSKQEFEKYLSDGMKVEMTDREERISKQKMSMEDFQLKLDELRSTTNWTEEEMEEKTKDLRAWYLRSEDLAEYYPEEYEKVGHEEPLGEKLAMPILERADGVNTDALSIIANAIVNALEDDDVEDRLEILSRHEIVMTSPGPDNYIETQRAFDANRGKIVNVQTQDPFGSNRVLVGNLVDRNALDVYINVGGRLVTIPLNMVAHVTLSDKNNDTSKAESEEKSLAA